MHNQPSHTTNVMAIQTKSTLSSSNHQLLQSILIVHSKPLFLVMNALPLSFLLFLLQNFISPSSSIHFFLHSSLFHVSMNILPTQNRNHYFSFPSRTTPHYSCIFKMQSITHLDHFWSCLSTPSHTPHIFCVRTWSILPPAIRNDRMPFRITTLNELTTRLPPHKYILYTTVYCSLLCL